MDYKNFHLENLKFRDDGSLKYKIYTFLVLFLGMSAPRPANLKRTGSWMFWMLKKRPHLAALGQAIGFDEPVMLESLSLHQHRYELWRISRILISIIGFGALAIFSFTSLGALMVNYTTGLPDAFATLLSLSVFPIIVFAVFVVATIIVRFVSRLMTTYFVESLCVSTIIYVILDLCRDNILTRPDAKKLLLYRINYLAELTLALALRYTRGNTDNKDWVKEHFRQLQLYIRERERWIIAPTFGTLATLRKDFYQLAPIYIMGDFGTFKWQSPVNSEKPEPNWKQRLAGGVVRFVGIIMPMGLMGAYLWQPSLFPFVHIDSNVVSLVFIAWLLLSIDITRKLGVVAELSKLAKGIKELG